MSKTKNSNSSNEKKLNLTVIVNMYIEENNTQTIALLLGYVWIHLKKKNVFQQIHFFKNFFS